jgi:hypothetical protein
MLSELFTLRAIEPFVDVLLTVEFEGWDVKDEDRCCPCCNELGRAHTAVCKLDAALTLAGLDIQEKRDAARKAMGL